MVPRPPTPRAQSWAESQQFRDGVEVKPIRERVPADQATGRGLALGQFAPESDHGGDHLVTDRVNSLLGVAGPENLTERPRVEVESFVRESIALTDRGGFCLARSEGSGIVSARIIRSRRSLTPNPRERLSGDVQVVHATPITREEQGCEINEIDEKARLAASPAPLFSSISFLS